MLFDIHKLRNVGISAHIDSGKTTLTERILFYTQRIFAIHEVKGRDGVGATMDSMELEKERGITIASAATHCEWKDHKINIIDTPGHVDFTIEVERALRVMDGAILILCAVGGVQSQSITVDRQMNRYQVPRIAFINKCDRLGANPLKVIDQLREKLRLNAVLLQLPIGLENNFTGLIDLVSMKAFRFDGKNGEAITEIPIPSEMLPEAEIKREGLLDAASMFSDELMEAIFDENITEEILINAIRTGVLARQLTPVLLGSAYKNIGVQLVLDAINKYLPSPLEATNTAFDLEDNEKEITLKSNSNLPFVGLGFKLEATQYGQLTYLRIYQGSLTKGDNIYISKTMKKIKVNRLIRMHANEMEDIQKAYAGEIVALFGIECISGDTFVDGSLKVSMSSMFVPEPVISLAITPVDNKSQNNMAKALNRFTKEDPTFKSHVDAESTEIIISGMGELHLDVYVERMRREFNANVTTGEPQVAYREAITKKANFDYTHKKQTGGSGQFGRIAGFMEPSEEGKYAFINKIKGGVIPTDHIPSVDKGFQLCLVKGNLLSFPIVGMNITINDGKSHSVDSSDLAFLQAAKGAFKQAYMKARPVILEPVMKISIETPSEFQGNVMGSINQKRGSITSFTEDGTFTIIEADVPLQEMFGYSTILRSMTQGKAEFTMEFSRYAKVPKLLEDELMKKNRA